MATGRARILIVTPNESLGRSLERALRENGYEIVTATDERSALDAVRQPNISLVLLDRQIVQFDRLRRDPLLRTVLLMAVQQPGLACVEEECAQDLDLGLDASVCNQTYRQLVARVRAILRAQEWQVASPAVFQSGGIVMNIDRHEVRVDGREVKLTLKEFQILRQLLRAPRRAFTRQELLNEVWGEGIALEEHVLDVHVHALRQKIEKDPGKPRHIVTVRGVGYKLVEGND